MDELKSCLYHSALFDSKSKGSLPTMSLARLFTVATIALALKAVTVSPHPTTPSDVVTFTTTMSEAHFARGDFVPRRKGSTLAILAIVSFAVSGGAVVKPFGAAPTPCNMVMTTPPAGGGVPKGRRRIEKVTLVKGAPMPRGPYSHPMAAGGFVFVSGQGPRDPASGMTPEGGIEEQTRLAIMNVQSVLRGVGLDLADVVKANVYLRDIRTFESFNRAYAGFFGDDPPARTTVQAELPSPETLVEIDGVA